MAKGLDGGSLGFSEHVALEPGSVPSMLLDKHLFVLQAPSGNEVEMC